MKMRGLLVAWAATLACAKQEPSSYEFVLRASSEPGRPLADVVFSYNDKEVGVTKSDGTFRLSINGEDGEVLTLSVLCPEGFQSPSSPVEVALRRGVDRTAKPEYAVLCPPKSRSVVVAIRADNGVNLPVHYLGREVARTDASGAAHVLIDAAAGDEFELSLDTTGAGAERLRPQNPGMKFTVRNQDEVFVFDQRFMVEPPARQAVYRPSRPTPLH